MVVWEYITRMKNMEKLRLERRVSQQANFRSSSCTRGANAVPRLSFDTAYACARGPLFAQAYRVTKDRKAAEEVVQEVFLYAWLNSESYNEERSSVLTWLSMLCRSRAIDYLRAHATQHRVEINTLSADEFESADLSPAHACEAARRSIALKEAMIGLSPVQREAIVLSYYAELSHDEIASQMDLPIGTVKTHIRRGKQGMSANAALKD
nr:RNA polymerase sigma factor [Duganella aceris]